MPAGSGIGIGFAGVAASDETRERDGGEEPERKSIHTLPTV
jgi:hypothetical protein